MLGKVNSKDNDLDIFEGHKMQNLSLENNRLIPYPKKH
jgi:hypothetical protein